MYLKGRKHARSYSSDSEADIPQKRRQASYPKPRGKALRKAKNINRKGRKSYIPRSSDILSYAPANTRFGEDAHPVVVPLTDLPELNHVAFGIPKTATAIVARTYLQDGEYYAHCSMEEQYDGQRLKYSSKLDANLLTHLMNKNLHNELAYQETHIMRVSAERLRKFIIGTAREVNYDITTSCIQCKQPLKVSVARPTECSPECQKGYDKWPIQTRLSPLLREPSVIDLLFTCLTAQLRAYTVGPDVPRRCTSVLPPLANHPFPVDDMLDIINSFPPMRPGINYEQLVNNGNDFLFHRRREVLGWLCSTFRGMIVPTPPADKVIFNMPLPGHAEAAGSSFLFLNTHQERHSRGGIAAFHGSPPHCVFNILCDGPNQNKISGGNVFYSKEPTVSIFYTWRSLSPEQSHIIGQGWSNSEFKGHDVLLGLEVGKPATFYGADHETNSHQDTVMVRHIFLLLPAIEETFRDMYGHSYWIQDESVRARMEETFRRVHDGRLIRDV
ncbi:hypothetical protein PG993_011474 [Apiospora rasikravindrae]|uniref:Uncharacterized protein n=1 Tax=Apiospora rasikravindrae TaxID=990691 RepID=A0ABR1SEH8_9PEZI